MNNEQLIIMLEEAKKKAEKEFYRGQHQHFDLDILQSFLERHGYKEIENWNSKVDQNKWDYNFTKYIHTAFKMDFLNFIKVKKNRSNDSLNQLQEDQPNHKIFGSGNYTTKPEDGNNIIDYVDEILMLIQDKVSPSEYEKFTRLVEGIAFTEDAFKKNGTLLAKKLTEEIDMSQDTITDKLKELQKLLLPHMQHLKAEAIANKKAYVLEGKRKSIKKVNY